MSENKLVGSLVLRTIDIDPTRLYPCTTANIAFDNDYGSCSANGGFITWKNVNIRCCLGNLYNKYDKFNLKLTGAQIKHSPGPPADCQFVIYISGLPFSSGSTYNSRLGPTNQSALGSVNFAVTTAIGTTTPLLSGLVTFDKPLQDVVNITLELKNSSTNTVTIAASGEKFYEKTLLILGHWSITCDIYGVDK